MPDFAPLNQQTGGARLLPVTLAWPESFADANAFRTATQSFPEGLLAGLPVGGRVLVRYTDDGSVWTWLRTDTQWSEDAVDPEYFVPEQLLMQPDVPPPLISSIIVAAAAFTPEGALTEDMPWVRVIALDQVSPTVTYALRPIPLTAS